MDHTKTFFFDFSQHSHLLPAVVDLHIACVQHDNALMRFHPPFTVEKRERMREWWQQRVDAINRGERTTIIAMTSIPSENNGQSEEISGIVELATPDTDTGPFRGEVEMLMVSPSFRGFGLARRLMAEVEAVAKDKGRTLLQLGTTRGSSAEVYVYPKLGYIRIGIVPNYGIVPNEGSLVDGVYFYKDLRNI